MDLWIRSQTRIGLIKTNDICIRSVLHKKDIDDKGKSVWQILANNEIVAEYFTKERAMEVLDNIQKLIMGQDIMIFYNIGLDYDGLKSLYKKAQEDRWIGLYSSNIDSEKIEYISPNSVVFEMPKE
jgi:hypothetical protein